jgi:hypothetical protein
MPTTHTISSGVSPDWYREVGQRIQFLRLLLMRARPAPDQCDIHGVPEPPFATEVPLGRLDETWPRRRIRDDKGLS